jgi:UDP-D-galactose:(glucosyl)LPS alpha-1,3-D-galactosyltransferase
MDDVVIVLAADARYLRPLLTTVVSLAVGGGIGTRGVPIRVLTNDLGLAHRRGLHAVARELALDLEVIDVDPVDDRFPVSDWISSAAYLRLELVRACAEARRAIYLDCDLVAVGDLQPLLCAETGPILAAVQDPGEPHVGQGEAIPGFEALGIPRGREYFNTGVMAIDVEAWRDEGIAERCKSFLVESPHHARYWDQDALNVVLEDRWCRLPPELNAFPVSAFPEWFDEPTRTALRNTEDSALILHFTGPIKPWTDGFPDGRARRTYHRYLAILDRLGVC